MWQQPLFYGKIAPKNCGWIIMKFSGNGDIGMNRRLHFGEVLDTCCLSVLNYNKLPIRYLLLHLSPSKALGDLHPAANFPTFCAWHPKRIILLTNKLIGKRWQNQNLLSRGKKTNENKKSTELRSCWATNQSLCLDAGSFLLFLLTTLNWILLKAIKEEGNRQIHTATH